VWDHLNKEIENFAVFGVKSAILTTSSKAPRSARETVSLSRHARDAVMAFKKKTASL
jgi:hypothetical protein